MRLHYAVAIMVAAVVALGCQGPYAASTYGPGETSLEHTEKLILVDRPLRKSIKLVEMQTSLLDDGRLEAYVELQNNTRKNLVVQVQTQFRDASGKLTDDMTNWRTIVMPPYSSTAYESRSMNDKAIDFVIRVKLATEH